MQHVWYLYMYGKPICQVLMLFLMLNIQSFFFGRRKVTHLLSFIAIKHCDVRVHARTNSRCRLCATNNRLYFIYGFVNGKRTRLLNMQNSTIKRQATKLQMPIVETQCVHVMPLNNFICSIIADTIVTAKLIYFSLNKNELKMN